MADFYEDYVRHVNPALGAFLKLTERGLKLERARGCVLEDAQGRKYDDWVSGFGSFNLGHNPEAVKEAIREHLLRDAPNLYCENLNPYAGALAAKLVAAAGPGFETCFFCNSGAEAVEAAIKTAILATGRKKILCAEGAYHGTTLGALACMGSGPYRDCLDDVLPAFWKVEFGDVSALGRALAKRDVAAFIVEPVQMEAGALVASSEYLGGAKEVCAQLGTLLVLDEVQTGMGRTGRLFACQHAGIEPDMILLAKSLGGGMAPIGAAVMAKGIWKRAFGTYLRSEIHNCTFGGNALSCAAALKTLEIVGEPSFLQAVEERGARLFDTLSAVLEGRKCVERISSLGLLGGIKFRECGHPWTKWENMGLPELREYPTAGALVIDRLFRKGILAQVCAHDWTVVRVEPPLTVDGAACDRFVEAVAAAAEWLDENAFR